MPFVDGDKERIMHGIPASGGVCRGRVHVLGFTQSEVARRQVESHEIPGEIERIQQALIQTRKEIQEVQRQVSEGMGAEQASIFEAHLLVLEDTMLLDEATRFIREEQTNAEYAFQRAARKYVAILEAIDDDFLRERSADMRDATDRILRNLLGKSISQNPAELDQPCILITHDLAPSTTALLDQSKVLGFATDIGSKTSHTAILARSLRLPAVVGLATVSRELRTGQEVLLDGYNGTLILNPSDQTLFEYGQIVRKRTVLDEHLAHHRGEPAVTLDGKKFTISANIERATGAEEAIDCGADGVGLYRTEYLYIQRNQLPKEEDQYQSYRRVAEVLNPRSVVLRTLDIGGDKLLSHLQIPTEMNPFLGWRAIRFCLQRQDLFRSQLRAILRASAHGNIKIMYPMVTCVDEIILANELLSECMEELRRENQAFDENIQIGARIETPSAAVSADAMARQVKFFSIGTNDLIQYTLAVDRLNEKIAHLYQPTNPAIIRLIKLTVDSAHAQDIPVSVCGEMAGDPLFVPLLLGLGVDELSAAPSLVPQIKFLIRTMEMKHALELAEFALNCGNGSEILQHCEQLSRISAPCLFENS